MTERTDPVGLGEPEWESDIIARLTRELGTARHEILVIQAVVAALKAEVTINRGEYASDSVIVDGIATRLDSVYKRLAALTGVGSEVVHAEEDDDA